MNPFFFVCGVILLAANHAVAKPALDGETGPIRNAVILIIRHAEKPNEGPNLSSEGIKRAEAYVDYFRTYEMDGKPLKLDFLFAAQDSDNSGRSRATITPLSRALGLKINDNFKDTQIAKLVGKLRSGKYDGKKVLIAWHHGEIPHLLEALGADPKQLLPDGRWLHSIFGWMIELRYDKDGHMQSKVINVNVRPNDAGYPPFKGF